MLLMKYDYELIVQLLKGMKYKWMLDLSLNN
jgi:hypothetical protein